MAHRPLILVPLDGKAASTTVLPAARRIADRTDGGIHILHVSRAPVPEHRLPSRLGLDRAELAGAGLEQASGDAAAGIVRVARERNAWLVAMTATEEPSREARKIGGTAAAVLQTIGCDVLVVRSGMAEPVRSLRDVRRLLLPLDGSPSAAAAVAPAAELARRIGARLDLLHIATLRKRLPEERGTMIGPRYLDAPEHEWPVWAQEFLERFGPPATGGLSKADVQLHVAHGEPGEEILRYAQARRIDLIAIAWHRTLAAGHAEIVKRLLQTAPCPLLFVRAEAKPEDIP